METEKITWLDPQVKDVTVNVDLVTAFNMTPETRVGFDEEDNLVLLNMRNSATGEISSMKLTGLQHLNAVPYQPMEAVTSFTVYYEKP
jgi:hypothetical protein